MKVWKSPSVFLGGEGSELLRFFGALDYYYILCICVMYCMYVMYFVLWREIRRLGFFVDGILYSFLINISAI